MTALQHLHLAAEALGLDLGLGLGLDGPRPAVLAARVLAFVAVALFLAPLAPRVWGRLGRPGTPKGTPPVLNLANLQTAVDQLKAVVANGRAIAADVKAAEPVIAAVVTDIETIGVDLAQIFAALRPPTNAPAVTHPDPTPTPTPTPTA